MNAPSASAHKSFRAGTHRLVPPEETLARVVPLLPVMGITRIANVTGLDRIGIPVVMVARPNSRSLAVTQGKGVTLAAAKASGVMEAVESYHAEQVSLPLKIGSYEELRYTHRLCDPASLPQVQMSLFHPERRILWIAGNDLMTGEEYWLPYELVHTDYTLPPPTGSGCFPRTSNGLASGNHLLEAISHGLCEVVERDSTALWLQEDLGRLEESRLDLATVDEPSCRELLARFDRAQVDVAVWETTTDLRIPSFVCTIVDRTVDPLRPLYAASGMGCHPAREIALSRALTEAAQSRLTYISGARDDADREVYEHGSNLDSLHGHRTHVGGGLPHRRFPDVPTFNGSTFEEDLAWLLARLVAVGLEHVNVVDLTKPELGIPVARVVVPGLEGSFEVKGYVPGPRAHARAKKGTA
jgi:ribosomal protein S12 methylthiotransferase accessory factor